VQFSLVNLLIFSSASPSWKPKFIMTEVMFTHSSWKPKFIMTEVMFTHSFLIIFKIHFNKDTQLIAIDKYMLYLLHDLE